jgi:hypothetical protein
MSNATTNDLSYVYVYMLNMMSGSASAIFSLHPRITKLLCIVVKIGNEKLLDNKKFIE